MSLNDFFAANGGVYLRPVGLQDCFPLPGMPHGCKPPQLTMQHPCGTPQKPRTMAAVSPLHQVVAQQNLTPYEANSLAYTTSRTTSSFAAALRKLAKQAVDPISGEKDITQISPVSSPALSQRSITPKRNGSNPNPQAMFLSSHQVSYASSSPPVVTIAPSRPHATHSADSRKLQVMDLSSLPQGNSASSINGHLSEPISLKLDSNKPVPRPTAGEKWDDHSLSNKVLPASTGSSQSRPHATIAPLPRPDDSLSSSRGFQPYRGAEDVRATLPHHISHFEHHPAAAYPYTPAFLPPPHLPHPAYRFDDPLYLDRYSLLRSSVMPFPAQPGMMAPPAAFYPNSRYAADLIAQSLSLSSAGNNILHHERLKQEEERRQREKELELDHSRKREHERERLREKEQKEKEHKEREHKEKDQKEKDKREREKSHREKEERGEHVEHKKVTNNSVSHSKRNESSSLRNGPVSHNNSNHLSPPVTSSNSAAPLNLVVHPSADHQRRESELWLPWQQHPSHHNNKDIHAEGIAYRHPTLVQQDNQRVDQPKENASADNLHILHNPAYFGEKTQQLNPVDNNRSEIESKKFSQNNKKFDSLHHHIAELSKKDHAAHEWKHEKLQKVCTNNHRKNNHNEAKKFKEDTSHGSLHQNHQRKPVNGLVKPAQCLDEGMHARLLETEKCRIEFNGHILNKMHIPNQMNDKMPVPTLQPNNVQINGKEVNSQKMYIENHISSVLKHRIESTPVISKLDKEAVDLQKKGFQDSDDEEVVMSNFLIITKGPAIPLDQNPKKMKFFKLLGITSHLKRKKIELEMYLKRRKILHEDSDTPPLQLDDDEKKDSKPLCEMYPNLEKLSEKLHSGANLDKLEFVVTLGLNPATLAEKEEKARQRKVIQEERAKRNQRLQAKIEKKASLRHPQPINEPENTNQESKPEVSVANGLLPGNVKTEDLERCEVKTASSSQTAAVQPEQVPYILASEAQESTVSNQALPPTKDFQFNVPLSRDAYGRKHNKMLTKYSFKRGHSLKREWRPPVPSLLKQINHRITSSESATVKLKWNADYKTRISTSTQVDGTLLNNSTNDKSWNSSHKNSFQWPGLDAVMEAYYRHNTEQSLEKDVLTERFYQLRTHQEDLKTKADNLSRSMSELLKLKRELDEKRHQYQLAIDNMKQCIEAAR